jgi:hypothetical protein
MHSWAGSSLEEEGIIVSTDYVVGRFVYEVVRERFGDEL